MPLQRTHRSLMPLPLFTFFSVLCGFSILLAFGRFFFLEVKAQEKVNGEVAIASGLIFQFASPRTGTLQDWCLGGGFWRVTSSLEAGLWRRRFFVHDVLLCVDREHEYISAPLVDQ